MLLVLVLSLAVVAVSAIDAPANLRGPSAKGHESHQVVQTFEQKMKADEKRLQKYLDELRQPPPGVELPHVAMARKNGTKAREVLDYGYDYRGGNPELNYDGFIINRHYVNNDCSKPVESVYGYLNCQSYSDGGGGGWSYKYTCEPSSYYGNAPQMRVEYYQTKNCMGIPYSSWTHDRKQCSWGDEMDCAKRDGPVLFAKKHDGLMTYKFRKMEHCRRFTENVLGYYANSHTDDFYGPVMDDNTAFDDYYGYDAQGPCCTAYEVQQGCPYRQCDHNEGSGDGYGSGEGGVVGRRHLAGTETEEGEADGTAVLESHPAATPYVKWWEKAEGPAHHRHKASAHKTRPTSTNNAVETAPVVAAVAANEHSAPHSAAAAVHPAAAVATTEVVVPLELDWYREYAFYQQRNKVCVYDEKYGLWVKTSCHGRVEKLVFLLFADQHCRKAIKRVEHHIRDIVSNYGYCVRGRKRPWREEEDHRVSLTVCHNSGDGKQSDWEPPANTPV